MAKDTLKIAITGHVDHGKSTLIGRLLLDTGSLPKGKIAELKRISNELGKDAELAYLIDQLKEEREQEKTIDTTQTFFRTSKKNFVIIDTPGHTEFLRNMLTGTSMAEAAVLIVDAHEGIMEQTRRHAFLLSMLGIKQVIVVVNKMDLVSFDQKVFDRISSLIKTFFKELGFAPEIMIPISAKEGINVSKKSKEIPWYKGPTLIEALESLKTENISLHKPLRLAVQDIYNVEGSKVLVGMISSGRIAEGEDVSIMPGGAKAKVLSVKSFGKEIKEASEGENIGITLKSDIAVRRGDVISDTSSPAKPTYSFSGELFWMAEEPIKRGAKITIRIATQEAECSLSKIKQRINSSSLDVIEEDASEIMQNEVGIVNIKTVSPIVVEDFSFIEGLGRFVIERDGEMLGAGIVRRGP